MKGERVTSVCVCVYLATDSITKVFSFEENLFFLIICDLVQSVVLVDNARVRLVVCFDRLIDILFHGYSLE